MSKKKTVRPLPPVDLLRSLFAYDPKTGVLKHRRRDLKHFKTAKACRSWNTRHAGKPALCPRPDGYQRVHVFGRVYYAHRVAWAIHHGRDPGELDVDHFDGDTSNNRARNLRAVPHKINQRNARRSVRNSSGFVGVVYVPSRGKWRANGTVNGRSRYLGYTDTLEQAAALRAQWQRTEGRKLGFTERHGLAA